MGNWYLNPLYPKSSGHYIKNDRRGQRYTSLCGQIFSPSLFPDFSYMAGRNIINKLLQLSPDDRRKCKVCLKIFEKL